MDVLTFPLDPDSKVTMYQQLYAFIKGEILAGRILADTRLPSKRKLSVHLSISQNTILGAYDQLIAEGYVRAEAKRGYFVCPLKDIVRLELPKEPFLDPKKQEDEKILFDFSFQGVDLEHFPFAVWRRFLKDAMHEHDPELLMVGDPQGHQDLRNSIAVYLRQSRGVQCDAAQVVISAGTEYLLQMLVQLLSRDTIYGLENPGYERLSLLFSSNRLLFRHVSIDQDGVLLEDIQAQEIDVICITPAHQFPTGSIMPINRRIQLINWAKEREHRYIVEDDYDSEFRYSGRPIPALQGLDDQGRVIYIGAFSKSLSPALRISYMVLPKPLLKQFREHLSYVVCPVPALDQKVLQRFIQEGLFERHLNRMRTIYRRKRERLLQSLKQERVHIEIEGADAGLHFLLRVGNGMTEEELVQSARRSGVMVYGISRCYARLRKGYDPPTLLMGYAAIPESHIPEAADRLLTAWDTRDGSKSHN